MSDMVQCNEPGWLIAWLIIDSKVSGRDWLAAAERHVIRVQRRVHADAVSLCRAGMIHLTEYDSVLAAMVQTVALAACTTLALLFPCDWNFRVQGVWKIGTDEEHIRMVCSRWIWRWCTVISASEVDGTGQETDLGLTVWTTTIFVWQNTEHTQIRLHVKNAMKYRNAYENTEI